MASDKDKITFVLVHGSWHDGNSWRFVEKHLHAAGHATLAPTLPGRGDSASMPITFQDCVDCVVDAVKAAGLSDIVLVGHSAGGSVVRKAAEMLADRVRRLVYISPLLAGNGEPVLAAVPPDYGALFKQMAEASPDNTVFPPWPAWRDGFIGDADEATAKAAFDELCPEPFGPIVEPIDLTTFETLQIPTSYINPTEDVVFPIGEWGFFPRMYHKVAPCRLVQIPGSHEVMYSNPEALAGALVVAGRD
ncbi:alpha/beta fold hydrolase [Hoeflea alexandrii]